MQFQITSIAEQELSEALAYYKEIDLSLAVRFLREFEVIRDRILQFPESGHPRRAYRVAIIHGFPYCVAYTHQPDCLIVEAVAHMHRDIAYWKDISGRL